ncbi:hypothetical protein RJ641_004758 [Dillenia turbinata]|uniref:Uncharacterized protein n=1 Tax=Dillenia turbinata TaxID=194707 RepID=A0AAN8VFC1_9MAGN
MAVYGYQVLGFLENRAFSVSFNAVNGFFERAGDYPLITAQISRSIISLHLVQLANWTPPSIPNRKPNQNFLFLQSNATSQTLFHFSKKSLVQLPHIPTSSHVLTSPPVPY